MRKTSILVQLIFIVVIPVVSVLFLLTFLSYNRTRTLFDKLNTSIEASITDEIIHAISLQEKGLAGIDVGINGRLKNVTSQIIEAYENGSINLEDADMSALAVELGMDAQQEDIYIINTNGIVINTTFAKDLNLDFFSFGESHKQFLLNVFDDKEFHCEGFGREATTMRLKKYSYQATSDGKYIVELGAYSKKADEIIDFNNRLLNRIAFSNEGMASIDLYFFADKPFTFNRSTVITDDDLEVLNHVFDAKKDTIVESFDAEDHFIHNYIWVPRKGGVLYQGAVIRIKEDTDYEAMFVRKELIISLLTVGGISFLISFLLMLLINQKISYPLQKINNLLLRLSKGEFRKSQHLSINSSNEIGEIAHSANTLVNSLRSIAHFADNIKDSRFEVDFEELGPRDELGTSLLKMRDSIKNNRILEENHRIDEDKRNWVSQGMTHLGTVITKNNNDIHKLSDEFLKELVKYMGVNQGAVFYLQEDTPPYLELFSAFAYETKKYVSKKIQLGEGLVGACAFEKETTYINDIPDEYVEIKSGMGGANPRSILLVPIMTELHFVGVIEIASFYEIPDHHIELVEKMAESLAISINNAMIHSKTKEIARENEEKSVLIGQLQNELEQSERELAALREEFEFMKGTVK